MKPVSAIELYKATPGTNCKECGFPTCLAFATCVIVEKKPLETCPYLTEEVLEELGKRIHEQQSEGVYVKRDLYKITADHIRERIESHDFSAIAEGLGAQYVEKDDQPHLRLSYLNRDCLLSKQEIWIEGSPADDHWDNILLYNYVHFSGNEPIRGEWIPIDNIPGNIPKKPELEHGCEQKIAAHFEGKADRLERAAERPRGEEGGGRVQRRRGPFLSPPAQDPFLPGLLGCRARGRVRSEGQGALRPVRHELSGHRIPGLPCREIRRRPDPGRRERGWVRRMMSARGIVDGPAVFC